MKRVLLVMVLFPLALAGVASAEIQKSDWQFRKSVKAQSVSDFVLANLDSEVLSHADQALTDLRLQDNLGNEVPYTIVPEGPNIARTNLPAKMFDKKFVEGKYTLLTLDLGSSGLLHNQLIITTDSENFRRVVEVESSDDLVSWAYLTTNEQVYDYTVEGTKPVKVQDTSVNYPESTARYLRLKILDNGALPLSITGVIVSRDTVNVIKEAEFKPSLNASAVSVDHITEIIADLGDSGLPTYRAYLKIDGDDFSRYLVLSGSNDRQNWNFLSNSYIFKINTPKFIGEQLTVNYPEIQYRYLKITIDNGDDKPLVVKEVKLFGLLRTLAFKYDPALTYYLYYGNKTAERPRYDIEKIFPYLEKRSMPTVDLGKEESNPDYQAPVPSPVPLTEKYPDILLVVLGLIVAAMGYLVMRLYTKSKRDRRQ